MSRLRTSNVALVRGATTLVLCVGIVGCRRWHPVTPGPASESHHYVRLLLVTRDGYQLELSDATVRSDSVVGTATPPQRPHRVAFARDDVVRMESAERDAQPVKDEARSFLESFGHAMLTLLGCVFTLGKVCG